MALALTLEAWLQSLERRSFAGPGRNMMLDRVSLGWHDPGHAQGPVRRDDRELLDVVEAGRAAADRESSGSGRGVCAAGGLRRRSRRTDGRSTGECTDRCGAGERTDR